MRKNEIRVYGGKIWGSIPVSKYGLEHGYLDYGALAKMVEHRIMNNLIRAETMGDWELINGKFENAVMCDYIVSELGATILYDLTDELVFYNEKLDLYIWAITHRGNDWTKTLTKVKLITEGVK